MRLILIGVFLIWARVCSAQPEDEIPDHLIKFSPAHLLSFYPTIQLAYEKNIIGNWSCQLDAGYVIDYNRSEDWERHRDKRGVKVKFEVRRYMRFRSEPGNLLYFAAEPYVNAVDFDRTVATVECFDAECQQQYIRNNNYKVEYREQGLSFKFGFFSFIRQSRFFFDVSSGVSIRNIRYRKPPGAPDRSEHPFDIPYERNRVTPGPSIGLRVGYRL